MTGALSVGLGGQTDWRYCTVVLFEIRRAMSYFRKNVERMQGYVPGEQPRSTDRIIKLNTNENPYPPSPNVRVAILDELAADGQSLRFYSDPVALQLRLAAAELHGCNVENVLAGNGSDELLALLFRAMVEPGEDVVYPYPTYTLYDTLAAAQGARVTTHDYGSDFSLPAELFGSNARLILVTNPNAPSGMLHQLASLRDLARSLTRGVLVIDEAYAEFAQTSAMELALSEPNVVVLRTFSKSYSLAGVRLGLLFGPPELVSGLNKVKDSYNLDRLAIVAGVAALKDQAWMRANTACILATRARLIAELAELGLSVLPSQTNFVLCRLATSAQAEAAYGYLKAHNVLVRYFKLRLLDDALRVTVGTDEEIDHFLSRLRAFLARK